MSNRFLASMDKKRLLIVSVCLGLIYLFSQLGLFAGLNNFFYSRYQSNSLEKLNQFSIITVEQKNKNNPSYSDWLDVIEKISAWSDSDLYIIDFFAQGDNSLLNDIVQNEKIHFIQSTSLDEDFNIKASELPNDFTVPNLYSINYPNFVQGHIQDYMVVEGLNSDVIEDFYQKRAQELNQPFNINFMIGESYLPAVNFTDIVDNKVDKRLFDKKSILIVNQISRIVPTVLSHKRPITQSQYYAYLFETALQDVEINKFDSISLLILIFIIGALVLLLSYFLPQRTRFAIGVLLSFVVIALSFVILGSTNLFIPVIEAILAVLLPMYIIQQHDSSLDQEQLSLGTRLYRQILDSSGKTEKLQSHTLLLESFSRFFCKLTGVNEIFYQISSKRKEYRYSFDGSALRQEDPNIHLEHKYNYSISLLKNLNANISIKEIPENTDVKTIENLLQNKEQYIKFLLSQFGSEQAEKSRGFFSKLLSRTRHTAEHEKFSITTDNFLSHYHLLKSNFESLQTASILYGLNGEIIQVNKATEKFIRENDVRLFNQSLTDSLIEITELDSELIRTALLDLINDQDAVVVWPTRKKGFDKGYLISLSAYTNENSYFGGFLIELFDIEEVNYISSLKNNFISELNNQLRNDFSEVMLAVDFLAMGIEGGPSLEDINKKVTEFSDKLKSSDMMLQTTNDIMRDKLYPVDVRELVARSVKAISEVVDEKQISVNIKQPRFINLVLVNYQHFAQVCKQLMLFAVQDCMDEGELSLVINEQEIDAQRFVSIIIKTKGYGIFDKAQETGNAKQEISEISELAHIEKYILNLGGQIELESRVGEGSQISTLLPCFRF